MVDKNRNEVVEGARCPDGSSSKRSRFLFFRRRGAALAPFCRDCRRGRQFVEVGFMSDISLTNMSSLEILVPGAKQKLTASGTSNLFTLLKDLKAKVDQACRTAEEFTKLYYESVDRKRHAHAHIYSAVIGSPYKRVRRKLKLGNFYGLMSRYYLDTGVLVWNGNGTIGKEMIQKFFEELPSSEHVIGSLDSQPVLDSIVSSQLTCVIQVSGFVRFQDNVSKPFQQSFMITAEGDKWKIACDNFRLQESVEESKKHSSELI
uniref:NTF2-related export protein n=1 Tax=Timema cristinae TaxID=61476 RepID=A0A7R9GQ90_TIMCR|nr:unnamed protein product [Timema cristinae]